MSEDDLPNQASESDNSTVDTLRDSRYSNPSNSSMIEAPIRSPAFVSDTEDNEDDDFDSFSLSSSDDDNESDVKKAEEEEKEEEERAEGEDLEELPTVGMDEQHESGLSFETDRTRSSQATEEVLQGAVEEETASGCPYQVYQSGSLALPEENRNGDSSNPSNQDLSLSTFRSSGQETDPQGSTILSLAFPTHPCEAVLDHEETHSQLSVSQDYVPIVPTTRVPDLDAALSAWVAGEDSASIITHVSAVVAELIAEIHEDPPEAQARRIVEVLSPLRHLPQPQQQPMEVAGVPVIVSGQQGDEDSSLTDLSNRVEDAVRLSTDPRIQIDHIVDAFLLNFFDCRQFVGMGNSSGHDDSLAGLIRRSSRVQRGEENRRPDPPGVAEIDLRRSRTLVDPPEEQDEDVDDESMDQSSCDEYSTSSLEHKRQRLSDPKEQDDKSADCNNGSTSSNQVHQGLPSSNQASIDEESTKSVSSKHAGLDDSASALKDEAVDIAVDSPRPSEPTSEPSVVKEPIQRAYGMDSPGAFSVTPFPQVNVQPLRDPATVPRRIPPDFDPAVAELSNQIRELTSSMAEMRQRLDQIVGPPPSPIRHSPVEVRPEQQASSPSLSVPPPLPPSQQVSSSLFSVSHSLPPAATEIVPTIVSIPDAVVVRSDDDDESTYLGEIQRATRERQATSPSSRRPRRRGLRRLFPWRWSSSKRPK